MEQKKNVLEVPAGAGLHTQYIQDALDACKESGGEVGLSAGEWRIASLRLWSNTTLHLLAGAHVTASDNWQDYTDFKIPTTLNYAHSPWLIDAWHLPDHYVNSPITAWNVENVAVIGEEDTWFDGSDCLDPDGEEHFRGPMGMVMSNCRGVTLKGYTYKRSANWAHQLDSCTDVRMSHITVLGGHDGVNIHHCRGVRIEDCDFRTGDDCVAGYDAENVTVRRCSFNTSCNSFRLGGRNVLVEDCRFWGPGEYPHRVSGRHNTLFALCYYAMHYDPCRFDSENWVIRRCTFDMIDNLMYYNYGNDWNHDDRPMRDLTLEDVRFTNILGGAHITPSSDAPITIKLKNVSLSWRNGLPEGGIVRTSDAVRFVLDNVKIQGIIS